MSAPAALSFAGIGKSFGGVPVLRDVSFSFAAGRTLGLIGENGAGKSTLMNLLGGNLRPDAGQMLLDGRPHAPAHPTAAARAGIAFIHQELNLFTNLSIAENIFLTALPRAGRAPFIDRRTLASRATGFLVQVGLPLPPTTLVESLSAGERQLVEIARALCFDARLLILDEPTSSLSSRETATLFRLLRGLRARGLTLIYISHVLEHVQQLCDDVVVLRDGAVVAQGPCAGFPVERMISAMVGRSLGQLYPVRTGRPSADPVLVVDRVSEPGIVRDISFTLHRGEVLGLSGLMGAGRSELARILFGLDPHTTGGIRLDDTPLGTAGPRERILVLGEGELRGEFTRPAFPREALLQAALPREERP